MSNTIAQSISCVDDAVVMIVSDEVEMVARAKIQQVLEFFYVELCRREIKKLLPKGCEGCEKHWPSRRDHVCMMTSNDELWLLYFEDVKNMINLDMIQDVCTNLVRLIEVPMSSELEAFVFNLPSMNSSVSVMIASDMSFPDRYERPIVNFVNAMCDVRQNGQYLSWEIFNEFVISI